MIANHYAKRAGLGHKALAVPLADRFSLQMIRREAYVWIQLSHDHILPLEGITNDFGPLPALVSLWMENRTLNDLLKREFSQLTHRRKLELVGGWLSSSMVYPEQRFQIRQIAAGLGYCASHRRWRRL